MSNNHSDQQLELSNKQAPVHVKDYYNQPAPGVVAHTREAEQSSANQYQHAQKTEFSSQDGTRGVATEQTKVTVERSGNANALQSGIHGTSSNVTESLVETKTTKTIATVIGHVEQEVLVANTAATRHHEHLSEQIQEAKREQYREERDEDRRSSTQTRTTEVRRQNSGPHARNVQMQSNNEVHADASYRDVRSEMAAPPYVVEKQGSHSHLDASYRSRPTDLAAPPYVVETEENFHLADASYIDNTRNFAAPPYVVESQRASPMVDASFRRPAADKPGPYMVESHNITTVTHKTSDIAAFPYIAENAPRKSHADARSSERIVDVASGPYIVESRSRESGVISERTATSDIAQGPYVSEKKGWSTVVDARAGETVSDIASGPYIVESRNQTNINVDARNSESVGDMAVGPYIVESRARESGLINEKTKTRDVAAGPYFVESKTVTTTKVDARSGESVRDVAAGPYVVESHGRESGLISERNMTSDIAAPPYVLVSEGQQRRVDASAFDKNVEIINIQHGGVASSTRKFEQGNFEEHRINKTQIDTGANIGERIDTFEHVHEEHLPYKKQVSIFGDVAGTIEQLREQTTVVEKTLPPQINARVMEKTEHFETRHEAPVQKTPVILAKHADIETIKHELYEKKTFEHTQVPQLHAHVREKTETIENLREAAPIVSQPVEVVKHASISQVGQELHHQPSNVVKMHPAPLIDVRERAEQLLEHNNQEVVGHKEVVVTRHVDDIKSDLLSQQHEVRQHVVPDVHTNVHKLVQKVEHIPAAVNILQREVSARGNVEEVRERLEHSTFDSAQQKHQQIEAHGHVRENLDMFESGSAYKMGHVTVSQPVEIAQIEVKRVERAADVGGSGEFNQQRVVTTSGGGNMSGLQSASKMVVDETVTVRINRDLQGRRVVPEAVVVEETQRSEVTETTTTTTTGGANLLYNQQQTGIDNARIREITNESAYTTNSESSAYKEQQPVPAERHHHHHHHHHRHQHDGSKTNASSAGVNNENVAQIEQLVMTTTTTETKQ